MFVDHCDPARPKCLHLVVFDVLAPENRGEESKEPASGNRTEEGDVEQSVVDAGFRGHQEVGGVSAVGDLDERRLTFNDPTVKFGKKVTGGIRIK